MSFNDKINGFLKKDKFSWNGRFLLKKDKNPKKPGGVSKDAEKIYVNLNPVSGEYLVSSDTRAIYKFNGVKDKIEILNDDQYKSFFKSKELKDNFSKVHNKTRKAILKISRQQEIDEGIDPNNPSSRTYYLGTRKAFRSFANRFIEINNGEKKDKPVKKNTKGGGKGGSGGGNKNNGNGKNSNDFQLTFKSKQNIPEPTKNPGIYRYPNYYLGDLGYDYIMFEPHEYVPSVKAKAKGQFGASTGEVIVLPMVPGLQSTNSTDWGDDRANLIQQMMGVMANNFILTSSDPQGELVSNIGKSLSNFMGELGTGIDTIMQDENLRQNAAAYFAGQAAGVNMLGRTTGNVINPNLELLFKGPRLRQFNFTFPMTPRTKDESETIRKICRIFKQRMAPRRSNTGLFLQTPYIFKLRYVLNDKTNKDHKYLNKFKPCALTNFSVNYTPDGNYATLHNGSMTKYTIAMSFGEIETIYADDYDSGKQGDMGF